ncbi:MAG: BatD family protein [Candidatus Omnitrophica bacterium]|nr:BatD family protein [Candidatus Omnitrophota bacterium]
MRYLIKVQIILLLGAMVFSSAIQAKEMTFEASLDKASVAIGEKAQLGLTFQGTQTMPAPDISSMDGLEIRYLGPSTMMTVINGKVSSSITHMYSVTPLKPGKFQLGPYSFNYMGDKYTSGIVYLEAEEGAVSARRPRTEKPPVSASELDLGDRIFVTLAVAKKTAYVNELVPITIKLYVNRLNVSDIQLPTFAQEDFSKVEFREPKQTREAYAGRIYDVLEFKTNIFSTRSGEFTIGPAQIKCNLMVKKRTRTAPNVDDFFDNQSPFDDFFTRYEKSPLELKSDDVKFTVLGLPEAGRPKDFSGAVGDYQFIFSATPKKLKVGDPLTVRMDINGTGNLNTVLIPKLENTDGFRMYEPQINTQERSKNFVQVLMPENDKVRQVPRATFTYFDPTRKEYKTITQGPIPIEVEKYKETGPAQVVGPPPAAPGTAMFEPREELARDIIYIKESIGHVVKKGRKLYENKIFLGALLLPLFFLLVFYVVNERRNRLRTDKKFAGRLAAFKASRHGFKKLNHCIETHNQKLFYDTLFKTLQGYLGGKLHIPAHGITFDVVEPALRKKGVDLEILHKIKRLFDVCDEAKFALSQMNELRMGDNVRDLKEMIAYVERLKL